MIKKSWKLAFLLCVIWLNIDECHAQNDKVIIFWYGMGMGHIVPAQRIAAYVQVKFEEQGENIEVKLVDVRQFSAFDERAEETGKQKYLNWASRETQSYTSYFRWYLEKHPESLKSNFDLLRLANYLFEEKPRLIIAVFWGAAHALYTIKKLFPDKFTLPLALLYTDYGIHKFVYMVPVVDKIFMGSQNLVQDIFQKYPNLTKFSEKFETSGIPVDIASIETLKKQSKADIRCAIKLDVEAQVITLARGGEAYIPLKDLIVALLDLLATIGGKHQLVVLAGASGEDKAELSTLLETYGEDKLKILNQIPNTTYLRYVRASDIFITKPGGVGLTEAALCEVPLIILQGLGGQEDDNLREFLDNGLAFDGSRLDDIIEKVSLLLRSEEVKKNMTKKQMEYFLNYNPVKIANWVWENSQHDMDWDKFRNAIDNKHNKRLLSDCIDLNPIALKHWYHYLNDMAMSDICRDQELGLLYREKAFLFIKKSLNMVKAKIASYELFLKEKSGKSKTLDYRIKWKLFKAIILEHSLHINLNKSYKSPYREILDSLTTDLLSLLDAEDRLLAQEGWEFSRCLLYQNLAYFYYLEEYHEKSLAYVNKAILLSEARHVNETLIQLKGDILIRFQRYHEAIAHFEHHLGVLPQLYGVRLSLAGLYDDLHRLDKSEQALQSLLQTKERLSELEYFKISGLYLKNGAALKAALLLSRGVSERPKSLFLHALFIRLLLNQKILQGQWAYELPKLVAAYRELRQKALKQLDDLPCIT